MKRNKRRKKNIYIYPFCNIFSILYRISMGKKKRGGKSFFFYEWKSFYMCFFYRYELFLKAWIFTLVLLLKIFSSGKFFRLKLFVFCRYSYIFAKVFFQSLQFFFLHNNVSFLWVKFFNFFFSWDKEENLMMFLV